tara:strand:+ start:168 stop:1724 length:1557 start_codon:yes stop_codon:yes gene_type:complete
VVVKSNNINNKQPSIVRGNDAWGYLILLISLLFLGYIIFLLYSWVNFQDEVYLRLDDPKAFDRSQKFSARKLLDNKGILLDGGVVGGELSFQYFPEHNLHGHSVNFSTTVDSDYDWDLGILCNLCEQGSKVEYFPFYRDISGYKKVAESDIHNIYVPDGDGFQYDNSFSSLGVWLDSNVPEGSTLSVLDPGLKLANFLKTNLPKIKNEMVAINPNIRGPFSLLVAADNKFEVKARIRHHKWSALEGTSVHLIIEDTNQNILNRSTLDLARGGVGEINISTNLPAAGLYRVSVQGIGGLETESLEINTNKFVFLPDGGPHGSHRLSGVYFNKAHELFISLVKPTNLTLYSWTSSALGEVDIRSISGNQAEQKEVEENDELDEIFTIKSDRLDEPVNFNLPAGNYIVPVPANVAFSGVEFSISQDYHFKPYKYRSVSGLDAEYIIARFDVEKKSSEGQKVNMEFDQQAINKNWDQEQGYVWFSMFSPKQKKDFSLHQASGGTPNDFLEPAYFSDFTISVE